MSSYQSFRLSHSQLSEEQEREVRDWVSDERSAGTVVREELIHWFAERVVQRDGVQDDIDAGFAYSFLSRHPDLVKRLVIPPQPSHDDLKVEKPSAPPRGLERMRERMRQDRIVSLYGDSPPPPRQPKPYPEGEIIYHFNCRYVVRHGDTITKYTTVPQGMGAKDHPNEATALRFIKENTTIPVPTLISSDWDRITMEYVEGQTLKQAWPALTPD